MSMLLQLWHIAIGLALFVLNRFLPKILKAKKAEDRISK